MTRQNVGSVRSVRGAILVCAAFGVCALIGAGIIHNRVQSLIARSVDRSLQSSIRTAENRASLAHGAEAPLSTLVFVGDIMLSRGVAWQVGKEGGNYSYPFEKVVGRIRSANLAFGNLEGPISARGTNQGSEFSFRAAPEALDGLAGAGFDVLSLANNHMWDWGRLALEDTVNSLGAARIVPVGAGRDALEANAPALFDVGGMRVGVLAFTTLYPAGLEAGTGTPGISATRRAAMVESVRRVRHDTDILVVSMHWGEEYRTEETADQRELGHALVDAGADFVIGHHPHVPEPIERYRTGWIAYSLGNFVFDRGISDETRNGIILSVTARGGDIVDVQEIRTRINDNFQPEIIGVY